MGVSNTTDKSCSFLLQSYWRPMLHSTEPHSFDILPVEMPVDIQGEIIYFVSPSPVLHSVRDFKPSPHFLVLTYNPQLMSTFILQMIQF